MRNITFDFLGQHRHGSAFHEFLRLRKTFFVDELGWDIPHNDDVEMDQYDNPCAHYSLVLRNGEVVGGARIMPTSSVWGRNTYMLRDALRGCLEQIPAGAMVQTGGTGRGGKGEGAPETGTPSPCGGGGNRTRVQWCRSGTSPGAATLSDSRPPSFVWHCSVIRSSYCLVSLTPP